MEKEKGFDLAGMFFVVNELNELNKALAKPLPKGFAHMGFCHFCLGHIKCGAWIDELLPPLKICERFQVDQRRVKELQRSFPANTRTMVVKGNPVTEIFLNIGGIIIKMPITQ